MQINHFEKAVTKLAVVGLVLTQAFVTASCRDLFSFEHVAEIDAVIPGATVVEQLLGTFPELDAGKFDFTQSAEFQRDGYGPEDVSFVHLSYLDMKVTRPQGQDLSFFGTVQFVLSAPGLDPVVIASQDDFPSGSASVEFKVTDRDLRDYLVQDNYEISVTVTDTRRPPQDTEIRITAKLDIGITASALNNER